MKKNQSTINSWNNQITAKQKDIIRLEKQIKDKESAIIDLQAKIAKEELKD